MIRHVPAFRVAFNTLLLAVFLPLLVFCAANVRQRQLQSLANPRWAEFAKTGVPRDTESLETSASPTHKTVSKNEPSVPARLASHSKGLTGSAIGGSPIEMAVTPANPVKIPPEPTRSAIKPRPLGDSRAPFIANSVARAPQPDRDVVAEGALPEPNLEVDRRPEVMFRPVAQDSIP